MTTLQSLSNSSSSLTFDQLKDDEALVGEIQVKLANLGLYPGGGWLDGDLGETSWVKVQGGRKEGEKLVR